ncbi:hypothetical protein ACIOJE_35805 [Kitasatospora sp. NPDC087861]|uniref:hypothetical protein n=1 Tax=Kitasatospora sp. NPDC087861 TaxID=3364070 RepID=UPI00380DCE66
MAEGADSSPSEAGQRVLNPLWIISLFLGLAEVTVGVASTQATGWVQGAFALFSVLFPSAIAIAFFRVLLTKPFVFYAPKDYSNPPEIETYVAALSSAAIGGRDNVEAAVRKAIEEVVIPRLPPGSRSDAKVVIDEAVRAARENLDRRSVAVDLGGIDPSLGGRILKFPVDIATHSNLLDAIYLMIRDHVDSHSYGRQWVLRDLSTGQSLAGIGGRDQGGNCKGRRSLQEMGLSPGGKLLAVRI